MEEEWLAHANDALPLNAFSVGEEQVNRNDSFQMFLMYQPDLNTYPNSIWVPVVVIPWGWSGLVGSSDGGVDWQFLLNPAASPTGFVNGNTTAKPPLWSTVCPPSP